MLLLDKQQLFAQRVGLLLTYAASRKLRVVIGEVERTAAQAALNAIRGRGILKSLHRLRLAIDLLLFNANGDYLNGQRPADVLLYELLGTYWKSLSTPEAICCWGGDFASKDLGHFSIEHQGIR